LEILEKLAHRGACGCEENTGDGAGILMQMPDTFMRKVAKQSGFELPAVGAYGGGSLLLAKDKGEAEQIKKIYEAVAAEEGQKLLGWRKIPTINSMLGPTALKSEPDMALVFIARGEGVKDQ